jgi:peptidase M28-like protein
MRELKQLAAVTVIVAPSLCHGAAPAAAPARIPEVGPAQTRPHVDPARIRAHVKVLLGYPLLGRGSGDRGRGAVADYIARQFASYGLSPAGDAGSFFQSVPLVQVTTLPETSFTIVTASLETITLRNLEDFVASNPSRTESAFIDAPIMFVGYGIAAPEYGWNDYKDADLNGRVALFIAGAPSAARDPQRFNAPATTDYRGSAYKFQEAARRGAIAALIIHREDPRGSDWQELRASWGSGRSYPRDDAAPQLQAASWLRLEAAQKLAAGAGLDLDQLLAQAQSADFKPVEMPLRLQAHVASRVRPYVARNVLAARPGEGALDEQGVLYTAGCDSAPINPPTKGRDDALAGATACAALLEIARGASRTPAPPPRMLVFAALTAEDQGLLGSQYLAQHSPVPPARISLELNLDPLAPAGQAGTVVVSGAERTTFYSSVSATAGMMGLAIASDPHPIPGTYENSTPFSFARLGVPAFSVTPPAELETTAGTGQPAPRAGGELPGITDFKESARLATFGYELGLKASREADLVGWRPGDVFAPIREHSEVLERLARDNARRKGKKRHSK